MPETISDLMVQNTKSDLGAGFKRELEYLGGLERDIPNLLGRLDALISTGKELGVDVELMVTVREAVKVGMDSAMVIIRPVLEQLAKGA